MSKLMPRVRAVQKLECLNGGVLDNGKCNCKPGYSGNTCNMFDQLKADDDPILRKRPDLRKSYGPVGCGAITNPMARCQCVSDPTHGGKVCEVMGFTGTCQFKDNSGKTITDPDCFSCSEMCNKDASYGGLRQKCCPGGGGRGDDNVQPGCPGGTYDNCIQIADVMSEKTKKEKEDKQKLFFECRDRCNDDLGVSPPISPPESEPGTGDSTPKPVLTTPKPVLRIPNPKIDTKPGISTQHLSDLVSVLLNNRIRLSSNKTPKAQVQIARIDKQLSDLGYNPNKSHMFLYVSIAILIVGLLISGLYIYYRHTTMIPLNVTQPSFYRNTLPFRNRRIKLRSRPM